MTGIDWTRYAVAVLLVVITPGAVLYWFAIHPFARFWRRVGHRWALLCGFSVMGLTTWLLWAVRRPLLAVDFGPSLVTAVPGIAMLAVSGILRRAVTRHLNLSTLMGLPEVAPGQYQSRLLDQGIYGRVRHPRYLQLALGAAGWALVSNYLAAYVVVACLLAVFAALIPMEERELLERFGPAYEEYRRRVPALVPRW